MLTLLFSGQDLVPEPEIQVQEAVQKRRGPLGAQSQRQRLYGLQLTALPRSVGEQHPSEHSDQQTSGAAADAQLFSAIHGGLQQPLVPAGITPTAPGHRAPPSPTAKRGSCLLTLTLEQILFP